MRALGHKDKTVPETESGEVATLEIGKWFWVKDDDGDEWFGCIVHIGSNYAEVSNVHRGSCRIHFDEFDAMCRFEPAPTAFIRSKIQTYQDEVNRLMGRVKELTARLGVAM